MVNANVDFKNILKKGVLSGLFFTLVWSSWAYYINFGVDSELAIEAAKTQAIFTIINAFIYTVTLDYILCRIDKTLAAFIISFFLPNIITTSVLYSMHALNGTPKILETILPSMIFIYLVSLVYITLNLRKRGKSQFITEVR